MSDNTFADELQTIADKTGDANSNLTTEKAVPYISPTNQYSIINNETGKQSFIQKEDWKNYKFKGYKFETADDYIARKKIEDVDNPAEAFVGAAASEATVGLSDLALGALGVDMGRQKEVRETSPIAAGVGSAAGFLGTIASPGTLAKAPLAAIKLAGKVGAKVAGKKVAMKVASEGSELAIKQFYHLSPGAKEAVKNIGNVSKHSIDDLAQAVKLQADEIAKMDKAILDTPLTPNMVKDYNLHLNQLQNKKTRLAGFEISRGGPGKQLPQVTDDLAFQQKIITDAGGERASLRQVPNEINRITDSTIEGLRASDLSSDLILKNITKAEKQGADALRIANNIMPLAALNNVSMALATEGVLNVKKLVPSARKAFNEAVEAKVAFGLTKEVAEKMTQQEIKEIAKTGLATTVINNAFTMSGIQAGQALSNGLLNEDNSSEVVENIKKAAIDGFTIGGATSLGLGALGVLGKGVVTKIGKKRLNRTLPLKQSGTTLDAELFSKEMNPILVELGVSKKELSQWRNLAHRATGGSTKAGTTFLKKFNAMKAGMSKPNQQILTNAEAKLKTAVFEDVKNITLGKRKQLQGIIDQFERSGSLDAGERLALQGLKKQASVFDNALEDLIVTNISPMAMNIAKAAGIAIALPTALGAIGRGYEWGGITGAAGAATGLGYAMSGLRSKWVVDLMKRGAFAPKWLSKQYVQKNTLTKDLIGSLGSLTGLGAARIASDNIKLSSFADESVIKEITDGIDSPNDLQVIRNNIREMNLNDNIVPGARVNNELGQAVKNSNKNILEQLKKAFKTDINRKLTRKEMIDAKDAVQIIFNPGKVLELLDNGSIKKSDVDILEAVNPSLFNNIKQLVIGIEDIANNEQQPITRKQQRMYDLFKEADGIKRTQFFQSLDEQVKKINSKSKQNSSPNIQTPIINEKEIF